MTEKLKPEQRKLWRRIYLAEFECCNASPEEAAAMADKVVAQWERRGAFDEATIDATTIATAHSEPSIIDQTVHPHHHLRVRFPIYDVGSRPAVGDTLFCESSTDRGHGVVCSYRIHKSDTIDVNIVAHGGNPNEGATWTFYAHRPGIGASGTVLFESSGTHNHPRPDSI